MRVLISLAARRVGARCVDPALPAGEFLDVLAQARIDGPFHRMIADMATEPVGHVRPSSALPRNSSAATASGDYGIYLGPASLPWRGRLRPFA
ncbi:hypothetical protein [Streptomyces albipurpureus]|uniref:Uncharacterized protein n=1 Tax=Streptomyces albipurpureus TaxID=2897419 RepID=A0ABT0UTE1_9ACTN|nr:hypothetical protein [Streptomyces sp. CWNU-1]MCM2390638.1 hypothetical protein [Streptomyces sp. CWNU-1]